MRELWFDMRNHIEFKPIYVTSTTAVYVITMTRGILVASVLWMASLSVALPRAEAPQSAPPRPAPRRARRPSTARVVDKYCVTCHNQRLKTGGLTLDTPDLANVAAHPDVWEKVIRKVEAGMMPPAGVPRPDAATRKALVAQPGRRARSCRESVAQSGSATRPSVESRRVRQRDS